METVITKKLNHQDKEFKSLVIRRIQNADIMDTFNVAILKVSGEIVIEPRYGGSMFNDGKHPLFDYKGSFSFALGVSIVKGETTFTEFIS